MALSRKRKKELKRLRDAASDVWGDQKDILEHASRVVLEASRQAGHVGREEVAPRVKDVLDNRVRPGVSAGISSARSAAGSARGSLRHDVAPALSSTLGSALALLDVAKDPKVREALAKVNKVKSQVSTKVGVTPPKQSAGPGRYILLAVALIGVAGVAYAAWQTLRADDELWVSDDPEDDAPEK